MCTGGMADEVVTVDFSPLSLSIDSQELSEGDFKSVADEMMRALTTLGIARLSNTGINQLLVCTDACCSTLNGMARQPSG